MRPFQQRFNKLYLASFFGLAFAGLASYAYARKIEPEWVDITSLSLTLPSLHPQFQGYRLVQISDIHMDTWMTRQQLEEVVQLVNGLEPDLVAVTGDFVSKHPYKYAHDLIDPLSRLSARDGVVAVLGNHDHKSGSRKVRQILEQAGMRSLINDVHTIHREDGQIHLAGVDDYSHRKANIMRVLDRLPEKGAAILLAHEPDFADISARTGRFGLQISGHSHGGQVRVPFIGALFLPRNAHKYPIGLYQVRDMLLYTNRGLGMVHLPFRFNCRPEITLFTLCQK